MREMSPEFTPEYEQQQHYKRLRATRPAPKRESRAKQKKLKLLTIKRIEVIQMADLPRYHYEVWVDFDNGDAEMLQRDYIHGLGNALRMAREKWGNHHRIDLSRWHPKKHLPPLVISGGA